MKSDIMIATATYQCENCGVLVVGEFDDGRTPLWMGTSVEHNDHCYPQGESGCESCSLEKLNLSGVRA